MSKKKPNNKKGKIRLSKEPDVLTEPVSHYLDNNVRFSLKHCSFGDKWCIKNLDKNDLKHLYSTLGKFEGYTWKDFNTAPRENSFTPEYKGTCVYGRLQSAKPDIGRYGHIRVNGTDGGKFRVFGAIERDIMYILLFDRDGKLQH